jgi:hypothetical protein
MSEHKILPIFWGIVMSEHKISGIYASYQQLVLFASFDEHICLT